MTKWYNELNNKVQKYIKIVSTLVIITPSIIVGVKKSIPYINFVIKGPELVNNVSELKEALLLTNSILSANLECVDSTEYKVNWKDHLYRGKLKSTKSGNVFLRDGIIGVQSFAASYDNDNCKWYFIDFDGNRIDLIP